MGAAQTHRDASLPVFLRVLHVSFVFLLLVQCLYSLWQVFVVMRPVGAYGVLLFGQARELDPEFVIVRRLYAIEGWVSLGILAVYLAVTEILPRKLLR